MAVRQGPAGKPRWGLNAPKIEEGKILLQAIYLNYYESFKNSYAVPTKVRRPKKLAKNFSIF
jgi:hypothetical protein